jgi:hypothetical protein
MIVTLTGDYYIDEPSGPTVINLRNASGNDYTVWTPMGTSTILNGNGLPGGLTMGSVSIPMPGSGSLLTLFYADGVFSEPLSNGMWYGSP